MHRFKTLTTKLYIDGVKVGNYPPFYNDKNIIMIILYAENRAIKNMGLYRHKFAKMAG
jgi:hypothetical protein